ncbi:hypothetical protein KUTeg_008452 [Tegillarca granosa]|uniref:Carbohydrate kinase FGGY C-terminal domain-containing protein n=1 Tax=Tegillarca granosa TaxID=220873 RepID=A0ABQ9FBC6_TEGGR|nr:hypothetical protein KUTeg_008452 [Tegillarca granosa]
MDRRSQPGLRILKLIPFHSANDCHAFDAISEESGHTINSLRVDGGMIVNNFLMQFQSDLIGVEVEMP